ncbi:general stress protein CsbD [Ectothiorhodospira shaposhnikovii]|uniref:CsbD family protein n=1 Tax=Ectothiorhodospira shaposhnikovii TaxID=1054 RepID=UPI00190426DC|nr:CsbD family protein [Ectothiorhodospira shaposhnikovii]MBK1672459.1 general stress protein CsbD [Ectothiorhodospira shaposhnikovii]
MNKDQVEGRAKETTGKVKEVTGRAVGNDELENKGKIQKGTGKVQAGYGDLKEDLKKGNR